MRNLLQSRTFAWCAFILVLIAVILSVVMIRTWKTAIWTLADEFFAFMMVFSQLVGVYIRKYSVSAGQKLSLAAAVFGIFDDNFPYCGSLYSLKDDICILSLQPEPIKAPAIIFQIKC